MEFALDRWITKHNAWIDVFGPNYMRWIFRDVKMTILFLGQFLFGKVLQVFKAGVLLGAVSCILFVPGLKAENSRPFVIPALQEWKGGDGYWRSSCRLVLDPRYAAELNPVANTFAEDLAVMFGRKYKVAEGVSACSGDIFLTLAGKETEENREKYYLDVSDRMVLTGATTQAVFWGTRTILQMMEQYDGAVPQGVAVDWPNYPKRGFMLDVGRKFVPIGFLRDYVKIMSYYKMNCFQIHLNDNGFKKFYGNDWSQTPAAFRL